MASRESRVMCLMCLDSPAVAKLGSCQHSYCKRCLFSHMESQLENNHDETATRTSIACPTCCTPPNSTQEEEPSKANRGASEAGAEVLVVSGDVNGLENEGSCGICRYRGNEVPALSVCEDCSSVLLCKDCIRQHRTNKLTINHILLPVSPLWLQKKKGTLCGVHAKLMKYFCTACSKSVCCACVLLDHEGHEIKQLGEVFRSEVAEVRQTCILQENVLAELQADEKELINFNATITGMEDSVIQAIEDQAEVCIEQILKTKQSLKDQARSYFSVRLEISKRLEAMPGLIAKATEVVSNTQRLLNETEMLPKYVDELVALKKQMNPRQTSSGLTAEYVQAREAYKTKYQELCHASPAFIPSTPEIVYGEVHTTRVGPDVNHPSYCSRCDLFGELRTAKIKHRGARSQTRSFYYCHGCKNECLTVVKKREMQKDGTYRHAQWFYD